MTTSIKKHTKNEAVYSYLWDCMADAVQVKENTGFSIGGVSPVGHLNKLEILIDKSFDRFVDVFAAAVHCNA